MFAYRRSTCNKERHMTRKAKRKPAPKKNPQVREVFSVRFSETELQQLRSEANLRRSSIAGTVRNIVLDSINRPRMRSVMLGENTESRFWARISGQGETSGAS
jgi:hypothetical protein